MHDFTISYHSFPQVPQPGFVSGPFVTKRQHQDDQSLTAFEVRAELAPETAGAYCYLAETDNYDNRRLLLGWMVGKKSVRGSDFRPPTNGSIAMVENMAVNSAVNQSRSLANRLFGPNRF